MASPHGSPRYRERIIPRETTLLAALQRMDELAVKLLIVFDDDRFAGLISIGDLQRAIIANAPMDTLVGTLMRSDIIIAREGEDPAAVRERMIAIRAECMPVLGPGDTLADVIYWEDLFPGDPARPPARLDTPLVIMAGGKGTRLQPLTHVLPKPLLPIGERTMVEEIIDRFARHGIPEVVISLHYKHQLVRFYLDQVDLPCPAEFIVEKDFYGTAGSLALLKGRFGGTFFVTNCDVLIDDDYAAILDYHRSAGNSVTLVAALKSNKIPYGTVESGEDGELISLTEKPEHTYLVNTGLYILEPRVLDLLEDEAFCHITELMERARTAGLRVGVFPISDKSWVDIGEWPAYRESLLSYSETQ